MDVIAEIRRRHQVSKEIISSIARSLNLSWPTVHRHLQTETEPVYQRWHQLCAQRRTVRQLFEGL